MCHMASVHWAGWAARSDLSHSSCGEPADVELLLCSPTMCPAPTRTWPDTTTAALMPGEPGPAGPAPAGPTGWSCEHVVRSATATSKRPNARTLCPREGRWGRRWRLGIPNLTHDLGTVI